MGHAIVGKFSHSIPSSSQVQKALSNIKFKRDFNWNYINAKHIIIQFEDIEDYAKMLNGPNGAPVWFVEHHPMRVFKWTPTFDSFFETPIAAIWCNVIAVPIHLFEVSALFAIGYLLGNPILIDHDTVTKKRLSFARICVEIDISKPPTEEVVLDILGKESVLKVKWEKIPLYCRDCKHVGHSSRNCHAFGKKVNPPVRVPNHPHMERYQEYRVRNTHKAEGGGTSHHYNSRKEHDIEKGKGIQQDQHKNKKVDQQGGQEASWSGRPKSPTFAEFLDKDGFIKQGRKGRKVKQGSNFETTLRRSNSVDRAPKEAIVADKPGREGRFFSATTESSKQGRPNLAKQNDKPDWSLSQHMEPNSFQQLQRDDTPSDEEVEEMTMEDCQGRQIRRENLDKPPDLHKGSGRRESEVETEQRSYGSTNPNRI